MEKFCYLCNKIAAGRGAFDSVISKIRSGWCKFNDLVLLSANKCLPLGATGRSYSACVWNIMLYGTETWPVKEKDVSRLEGNDPWMVRWMCNVRPKERISAIELRTRLKLKSMRQCLLDRRLQSFGHLEKMEEGARSSKCRAFKVSNSFPQGQQRKTWNVVTRKDLKERNVIKDIAKDRNVCKSFIRNSPTHTSMENMHLKYLWWCLLFLTVSVHTFKRVKSTNKSTKSLPDMYF